MSVGYVGFAEGLFSYSLFRISLLCVLRASVVILHCRIVALAYCRIFSRLPTSVFRLRSSVFGLPTSYSLKTYIFFNLLFVQAA